MKLSECKIIDIPTHEDLRGCLSVLDQNAIKSLLPFQFQRLFWIHSIPFNTERGQHAHRTCWEFVLAISGQFTLTLHDGSQEQKFILDSPNRGVIIPPMVWCRLSDFSDNAVCLALASGDYDEEGYINDFCDFLKAVNR